ncbi:hypothetical protein ILUMI_01247 [Ignelater luminosus]|uniref:Uncharacterized protein n=1 Tax=Ignelater luminosus TaxID=2038154 RepID=A0A8K0DKC8_IGNLU|nr:hypothetical protein ILUMI_01247 [Ignelater luminosus]
MQIIEKDKKKSNIVLSGLPAGPKDGIKIKKEMEKFSKEIKDTGKIGNLKCVVEIKIIADKREVIKNKYKLRQVKNKMVYINEELTEKEREVQKNVKGTVAKELKTGNKVRIWYMKLNINEEDLKWNTEESELKKIINRRYRPTESKTEQYGV